MTQLDERAVLMADMHVHTVCSDGTLSVDEALRSAKSSGVKILAITDHDNMNACAELLDKAPEYGVRAVKGIEISAYDGMIKVHVLGYNVDDSLSNYKDFYKKLYDGSYDRTEDILHKLKCARVPLSLDDVLKERVCSDSPVHSMYIARAGAKRGYASSPFAFYAKYLANGGVGFSTVGRVSPTDAVKAVEDCGGIASLAHPARIEGSDSYRVALINKLVKVGLNGIEAVYSGHTNTETAYYKEIANEKNLLVTGGSDTHFAKSNKRIGVPRFLPDERLLLALKLI